MSARTPRASIHKPRELRRRVVLPARLRNGASWSDACILNLSSRGLMIQSARAGDEGTLLELRRGDHVIVARVVWRSGAKAGLRAEERIPVEEILTVAQSSEFQLRAVDGKNDRRKVPRSAEKSRQHGRAIEFAGVIVIATSLAGAALTIVEQAFATPLAAVETALSR